MVYGIKSLRQIWVHPNCCFMVFNSICYFVCKLLFIDRSIVGRSLQYQGISITLISTHIKDEPSMITDIVFRKLERWAKFELECLLLIFTSLSSLSYGLWLTCCDIFDDVILTFPVMCKTIDCIERSYIGVPSWFYLSNVTSFYPSFDANTTDLEISSPNNHVSFKGTWSKYCSLCWSPFDILRLGLLFAFDNLFCVFSKRFLNIFSAAPHFKSLDFKSICASNSPFFKAICGNGGD